MTTSTKKRKTIGLENDDPHNSIFQASPSPTKDRKTYKATRSEAKYTNNSFVVLKRQLCEEQKRTVMSKFEQFLSGSKPDLLLSETLKPNQAHPEFVTQSMVNLRWELAAWDELYNRPSGQVVLAFGQNDAGQLGMPSHDTDNDAMLDGIPATAIKEMSSRHVSQTACGGMHTIALTKDGMVFSFGANDDGALGRTTSDENEEAVPARVAYMVLSKNAVSKHQCLSTQDESNEIVMVSVGASHSLFLSVSGNVYMAGMYKDIDGSGKFSDPRPKDDTDTSDEQPKGTPKGIHKVPVHCYRMPGRVKFIASGGACNAAILEDDTLVTWGMGYSGEMARSKAMIQDLEHETENRPLRVDELKEVTVSTRNDKKFFIDNIMDRCLKPKPVEWANGRTDMIVTHVSMGESHILVCARAPDEPFSRAYSAGNGSYGKLGHGNEDAVHALTLIEALKEVPIARVAGGQQHSLFLHAKGDLVYACGQGDKGQLGIDPKIVEANKKGGGVGGIRTPLLVAFPNRDHTNMDEIGRIVGITCGENHSLAWTTTGKLYSWGYGEYGQAGNNPNLKGNDQDIKQPRLNDSWLDGKGEVVTYHASGGSQHSVVVATKY